MQFSKSCVPTRAGSSFSRKMANIWKERVCKAFKAQRKYQIAREIRKIVNVMHTFASAERPWRLKMHKSRAKMQILVGHRSGKLANQTSNRTTRARQLTKVDVFRTVWGSTKMDLLIESVQSRFSKMCFWLQRQAAC